VNFEINGYNGKHPEIGVLNLAKVGVVSSNLIARSSGKTQLNQMDTQCGVGACTRAPFLLRRSDGWALGGGVQDLNCRITGQISGNPARKNRR